MQSDVQEYLSRYKSQIDAAIETELDLRLEEAKEVGGELAPIIQAMQELAIGGKRLRGLLTILAYEISGGQVNKEIIRAAAIVELFHLGLLIQDDWMDRDELRRGVKTLHTRYADQHTGNFVAMLAGDFTFGWTVHTLAALKLPAEAVQAALQTWGKYMTRVGYGQTLDGLAVADGKTVLKILAIKSGEYSAVMPLLIGASLAGAEQDWKSKLEKYGMELGLVFQLRDDWLAAYGETAKTGKPVGNDEREHKPTYIAIYGKEKTEAEIVLHRERGREIAATISSKWLSVMSGLLEWMATRMN